MDWGAVCDAIAAPYGGLSDGAGTTLRSAEALPPDAPTPPCAVAVFRSVNDVVVMSGWMTGTATVDLMVLLAPEADVPRRMAALLRYMTPALSCGLAHVQIGMLPEVSSCVPTSATASLAGDSPDYAGMPFDMILLPYLVTFRTRAAVAP